jgi:hypothetical protein
MSAREEQLLLRARLRCLAKGQGPAGRVWVECLAFASPVFLLR